MSSFQLWLSSYKNKAQDVTNQNKLFILWEGNLFCFSLMLEFHNSDALSVISTEYCHFSSINQSMVHFSYSCQCISTQLKDQFAKCTFALFRVTAEVKKKDTLGFLPERCLTTVWMHLPVERTSIFSCPMWHVWYDWLHFPWIKHN